MTKRDTIIDAFRVSSFGLNSSFVIRHSVFVIHANSCLFVSMSG